MRRQLRRGTYVLPSLFTTGNIILGFAAIICGFRGDFHTAAMLVFIAGVLDGLDGRLARLVGTESEFGKEFDSLADVLTFGAAPALLIYLWGLHELGRPGWLVPLFFLLCAAVRLARYNVQTKVVDSRFFVGLPAPMAGAGMISPLLLISGKNSPVPVTRELEIAMLVAVAVVGSLMVSTFRYPSGKKLDLRRRVSYRFALMLAAGILVLTYRPAAVIVATVLLYILSGPGSWLVGRLRRRPAKALVDAQGAPADAEELETS